MGNRLSMNTTVEFIKIHPDAQLPVRATTGSAGLDLFSVETLVLTPGQRALVSTGLKVSLEFGYEAQVRPRSGLSLKQGITVLNAPGTIDSDYTGELGVILYNASPTVVSISKGDRIAQLVVQPVVQVSTRLVSNFSVMKPSRGDQGYGSTGK